MLALSRYRKAITAAIGAVALIIGRHYGLNSEVYLDIVGVATILGVWAVPNE